MHKSSIWDLFEICDKYQPHTSLKACKNNSRTTRTLKAVMKSYEMQHLSMWTAIYHCWCLLLTGLLTVSIFLVILQTEKLLSRQEHMKSDDIHCYTISQTTLEGFSLKFPVMNNLSRIVRHNNIHTSNIYSSEMTNKTCTALSAKRLSRLIMYVLSVKMM